MRIHTKLALLAATALLAILFVCNLRAQRPAPPPPSQAPAQTSNQETRIRINTEIVLVNVIARDKHGNLIRDLKKDDFTVLEDGQRQQLASFDFENVDELALAAQQGTTVSGTAAPAPGAILKPDQQQSTLDARDRRLILMFFDFSAMEPDEIDRAVDSAKKYVSSSMKPADLVGMVSLATNLKVDLDFTADRPKILAQLSAYNSSEGQGFENSSTGSSEGSAESGGSYTPDDTDYNTFSADRKLLALQSVMLSLSKIPQKKSLVYFSNGISQSGVDNQSALRAATASAVKANVAIYPVDVRGLQAFPPGGQAQAASLHGQSAYSGASVINDLNSNAGSQETLYTLASDTGGKAFMDTNDFSGVFSQVQKDSSAYYVLGYTSTNRLKDGHFRRLKVQVNRPDIKLEYRSGYYAGRDYEHMNRPDRESQLEDELASDLPRTDVAIYAGTSYFRQDDSHYFLGVSLVVPGSQIPFVQAKDKDSATLDIIGQVLAGPRAPVGQLRDTVKLAVDTGQQVRRKNVQYNTSFILAPGTYHLKFIVRENRTGRMGSFETDVEVPDLRKAPLRMSSVVLSSLRAPVTNAPKKKGANPLIQDQTQLVPNVTHVFTRDQHLYLQYEIYDAAKGKVAVATAATAATAPANGGQPAQTEQSGHPQKDDPTRAAQTRESIHVLTSIEFLQGNVKVYESKQVAATEVTAPDRKAVVFQIDLPLQSLKPGLYVCQV